MEIEELIEILGVRTPRAKRYLAADLTVDAFYRLLRIRKPYAA